MIGFLLKKFLYDFWDNFFLIGILNIGFLLFLTLAFFLLQYFQATGIIFFLLGFLGLAYLLLILLCSTVSILKDASDYRRPNLADFPKNLKSALVPAAVLLAVLAFVFFIIRFTIPVYLGMENLAGLGAAFFSCWICLFIFASIQFYPSVYYRLGMHPVKSLKKCVLIVLDNTFFGFFTLFINIVLTVLVLPFPCCQLLFTDEALRLRLIKYDWLEKQAAEQQNINRQKNSGKTKIPWKKLLEEEKENTGSKSWKSFIFPWKQ